MLKIFLLFCLCSVLCFSSEEMSLEEKVGQLLMVHFHGEEVNEDAKTLIQETKVGAIIYYNWSNGLNSPEQVRALSLGLQKLTEANQIPIPLLIAADQEGGVVTRLNNGFTPFPGNKALGMSGNSTLAESAAFAIGQELRAVGINMNLAPVVDVNCNPRNPVIGVRSFGEGPEIVIDYGEKAISGYRQAQMISTLKHFPGYGDVALDPHEDLPIIRKSLKELERVELLPFAKLAGSADAIMTAHLLVPAFDEETCSTLSEKTLSYLRNTIGFQGVIVADSLVMDGVLKKCETVDEASIQALNAGCDLLILGGKLLSGEHVGFELTTPDVQRIARSIIDAVKSGRVSEERLNQAVERILKLKKRYLNSKPSTCEINSAEHRAIGGKIAALALQTIERRPIAPLSEKKVLVLAPQIIRENIEKTSLLSIGKSTDTYFLSSLNPSSQEADQVKQKAELADVILICSYNAWKNPAQEALIHALSVMDKPLVLLSLRDPLDASLFPKADLIFSTFSPTTPSIQAVCDRLSTIRRVVLKSGTQGKRKK
jgi:beta-N-acetylhexosaminidase